LFINNELLNYLEFVLNVDLIKTLFLPFLKKRCAAAQAKGKAKELGYVTVIY